MTGRLLVGTNHKDEHCSPLWIRKRVLVVLRGSSRLKPKANQGICWNSCMQDKPNFIFLVFPQIHFGYIQHALSPSWSKEIQRNQWVSALRVGEQRRTWKWERTGHRIVFAIRINFTGAKTRNHHPHLCLLGFALKFFDLDNGVTLTTSRETSPLEVCDFGRSC